MPFVICLYAYLGHMGLKSLPTGANKYNSCMTKHDLPYNFNICYRIYLKLTEINVIDMPDANKLENFENASPYFSTFLANHICD